MAFFLINNGVRKRIAVNLQKLNVGSGDVVCGRFAEGLPRVSKPTTVGIFGGSTEVNRKDASCCSIVR